MAKLTQLRNKASFAKFKLEALESDLNLLKIDFEDEGADQAANEIELAADAIYGAISSLRAALEYSEVDA